MRASSSLPLAARLARALPAPPAAQSALDALPEAIARRLSTDLVARLARLQPRTAIGTPHARASAERLAEEVGGTLVDPSVIHIEEHIPLPWAHGSSRLRPHREWRRVSGVDREVGDLDDVVLLDTETTGLAGGTGTVAFLVGTLAPCRGALRLRQWLLLGFSGEATLLDRVAEALPPDAGIVSYNGKPFDVPLLQTRYRMHGRPDPFADRPHLDLLPWVRRTRPRAWSDARLATVESEWMGLERVNDVGGAEVPASWRQWLDRGAIRPLALVLSHNRLDLLSLYATLQCAVEHEPDDLLRSRPQAGPRSRQASEATGASPVGGAGRGSTEASRATNVGRGLPPPLERDGERANLAKPSALAKPDPLGNAAARPRRSSRAPVEPTMRGAAGRVTASSTTRIPVSRPVSPRRSAPRGAPFEPRRVVACRRPLAGIQPGPEPLGVQPDVEIEDLEDAFGWMGEAARASVLEDDGPHAVQQKRRALGAGVGDAQRERAIAVDEVVHGAGERGQIA